MPFLLYYLVDLGYMSKEEEQMGYGDLNDATSRFAITEKGKAILDKWLAYRDREKPHSSPLPHHAAYGSVLRDSADQASSDPGERKSK